MPPKVLTIGKAESTFRAMLEKAGLTLVALHLEKALDVFVDFCNLPFETKTDGIIVQWGPLYEWRGEPPYQGDKIGFYYSVLRQFYDGGKEIEQLTLEWHYRLEDTLDTVEMDNTDWCCIDLGFNVAAFLQAQRETELFQLLKQCTAYETLLFQENIG